MPKLLHLQGIRGLAILSVIQFHYYPISYPNGFLGVDIFFVLSGYLMAMMVSRHDSIDSRIVLDFLYRRLKRIAPLYYLVMLITIGIIYFVPCNELPYNLPSADLAISLSTNIFINPMLGYFEQIGFLNDLFTHTWSLCLEMQFYLVFPLIWMLQRRFEGIRKIYLLQGIGAISLGIYILASDNNKFNNIFCRIWQFIAGNLVFSLEETEKSKYDSQSNSNSNFLLSSFSLCILFYSIFQERPICINFLRLCTTIATATVIHSGKNLALLENKVSVFLGEISYSWYLIHWPMLTIQKILSITQGKNMTYGLYSSLFIAILIHFFIEKPYLKFSNKIILSSGIVSLILMTFTANYLISESRMAECLRQPPIFTDFSTMTIGERKEYNYKITQNDWFQLVDKRCKFSEKLRKLQFEGFCKYENPVSPNQKTLLIVGNSWAANSVPIIYDECRNYVGNIIRRAHGGCEVLYEFGLSDYCKYSEQAYLDTVEEIQPDYLFIIVRFLESAKSHKQLVWETIQKTAKERILHFSKFVKEKIFILRTFPGVQLSESGLNLALEQGIHPSWNFSKDWDTDMEFLQKKYDQVFKESCPKCKVFDYAPQFTINGTFYPYHPDYFTPYLTYGQHFTLPGLERIRPIYSDICKKL